MSKPEILTARQILSCINNEGLAYAVNDYYGRHIECPEDRHLEALWKAAFDAMDALDKYVDTLQAKS